MPHPVQSSSEMMAAGKIPLSFKTISTLMFLRGQKAIHSWHPLQYFLLIFILAMFVKPSSNAGLETAYPFDLPSASFAAPAIPLAVRP